jgi:hypothetical protein
MVSAGLPIFLIGFPRDEVSLGPVPVTGPRRHCVLRSAGRQRLGPAAAGTRTVARACQNRKRSAVDQPGEHNNAGRGRDEALLARCRCLCSGALIHCNGLQRRNVRRRCEIALDEVEALSAPHLIHESRTGQGTITTGFSIPLATQGFFRCDGSMDSDAAIL